MNLVLAVMAKDMRLAWRDRAGWLSAAAFAAVSVLTYSFAFDLATRDVRPLLPGVLWTTFLFAGVFAAGQGFAHEMEEGTFDAMLLAPIPATAIFVGKLLSNLSALVVIEFALLILGTILFDVPLLTVEVVLIVLLGTAGYVSLTTLLGTMGSAMRSRAVLLPVLALPLLVPLLLGATSATSEALGITAPSAPWTLLLAVFAVWSAAVAALLFPLAVER